ncbi:MAG TPA: hypothetical protein VK279_06730 [Solirubrobacteraceae bacterium]|nr:hypothetical protein [Solirubrobacteraceae bacterium]
MRKATAARFLPYPRLGDAEHGGGLPGVDERRRLAFGEQLLDARVVDEVDPREVPDVAA